MTTLTEFFKKSDTSLGVFYPTNFIIAAFPEFASARSAAQALYTRGFSEQDVLAVPGAEVLQYFEEFRSHAGLWSGVMSMVSRAFGTEQVYADFDVRHAEAGDGFLAIHCPTEALATRAQALVKPFGPLAMHWYLSGGVESLV